MSASYANAAALPADEVRARRPAPYRVMPGFNLSLGFTIFYLALIVLIPLSAVFLKTFTLTWEQFWHAVTSERVMASYRLTFGASLIAATINAFFGGIVAWVLVRYEFPGKRIVDALVDLPFALPTAVAGITLTALYSANGWFGSFLEGKLGLEVERYTPDAEGIVVRLRHVHAIGPLAQLELERTDNADLVEAVIPNERYRQLGLKDGETLVVRPKRLHVFVDEGISI